MTGDDFTDEDVARHPYDALTPDAILSAVESRGLLTDGRMLALNSYENRVYRVGIEEEEPIVAKFYRPGRWTSEAIIEEHAFALELSELEIPVVAPLSDDDGRTLHEYGGFQFALFPLRPGRWPDLETFEDRLSLGRFIGRIHAVGATRTFSDRLNFNVATFGRAPLADLLASGCVPLEMSDNLGQAASALLDAVEARFNALAPETVRAHGDFHLGNVLWSSLGPSIVDLDDCCNAPPIQDLWMLLDGTRADMQGQLLDLLEGYEEFFELDYATVGLIEALRGMRMVRFNGWIAARWQDPAFPRAFPWFDTPNHWESQLVTFREQLERIHEPALRVT